MSEIARSDREAAKRAAAFDRHAKRTSEDGCWPWSGSIGFAGYGQFNKKPATHIALELDGRPNPGGLQALHSCDNRICVNPKHLRWGTPRENADDMVSRQRHHNNRKTHCLRGHELIGQNLLIRSNGQRGCRTCQHDRDAAYKKRVAQRGA